VVYTDRMSDPLRLLIFDRTCRGGAWPGLGLSHAWRAGAALYRGLRRLDHCLGASSWQEALEWLATVDETRPVGEIQFWGHGKWGLARIGAEPLDRGCLEDGHRLSPLLRAIRRRMVPDRGLWWFRTCETLGAAPGHDFARAWSDFFGVAVAGHSFIIGFYQSGLHRLRPGEVPGWSPEEGLRRGTPAAPEEALPSRPWAPNTITCLQGSIPDGLV
jgi:hypothetical protein